MIFLTSTSDKIQIITSAALATDVHVSWADNASGTITVGRTNTPISTAATTDVSGSPGSGTQRKIKILSIYNEDASNPNTITVQHTDGSNVAILKKVSLLAGESLLYIEGRGWLHYDSDGVEKTAAVNNPVTVKSLAADQSNSTTTPTVVNGLTMPVGIGTYAFQYYIRYQSGATTTGVRFSVNHSGTVAFFLANQYWVDNSATAATAAADQDAVAATGQVTGTMAARAKSTAGW